MSQEPLIRPVQSGSLGVLTNHRNVVFTHHDDISKCALRTSVDGSENATLAIINVVST